MNNIRKMIFDAQIAVCSLIIYRNILNDPLVKKFLQILDLTLEETTTQILISNYHDFFSSLVTQNGNYKEPTVGNLWQDYILNLVLADENPFSLQCEKTGIAELGQHLIKLTQGDLTSLQKLYDFDFSALTSYIRQKSGGVFVGFPVMYTLENEEHFSYPESYFKQKYNIKKIMSNSLKWNQNITVLAEFYRKKGCGKFARFWAFKWVNTEDGGKLVGIPKPDPISLNDLIGYEEQKHQVLRNTQQFVQGFGANNILLYGDRGTGKSSTIKALIHEFGEEGLRMVEVTKEQLMSLPNIIVKLSDRPYRFIIFVDDLSFEEHETEYKYLKAVLEGSLEPAPENVLIYATSNRRHLIREYHSDRAQDELRAQDTLQEKLSLSDRFGITVIYPSPDQEEYLKIVQGIAESKGIDIEPKKLRQMALKWELWHNLRSGRTAKQFIEDLLGRFKRT
ncbi:MAG: ATP-binding protein [Thermoanaerobacteraceae bacterium]|nr:ATP-binding protein [Thermoanaerobacteraceae bacterium]